MTDTPNIPAAPAVPAGAAPVVPAPAPAPAVPSPAPVTTEPPVDTPDGILPEAPKEQPKVYAKFNDTHLDGIVAVLEESGVTPDIADSLFADAIQAQDFSKIDLDKISKTIGDKKTSVVKALIDAYEIKYNAEIIKGKQLAVEVFGSEQELTNFQKWVQSKESSDAAFAKELKSYRKILESKDPANIKLVLNNLKGKYAEDSNTVNGGNSLISGDSTTPVSTGISSVEYGKRVREAVQVGNYDRVKNTLAAQRALGEKQGLR